MLWNAAFCCKQIIKKLPWLYIGIIALQWLGHHGILQWPEFSVLMRWKMPFLYITLHVTVPRELCSTWQILLLSPSAPVKKMYGEIPACWLRLVAGAHACQFYFCRVHMGSKPQYNSHFCTGQCVRLDTSLPLRHGTVILLYNLCCCICAHGRKQSLYSDHHECVHSYVYILKK